MAFVLALNARDMQGLLLPASAIYTEGLHNVLFLAAHMIHLINFAGMEVPYCVCEHRSA